MYDFKNGKNIFTPPGLDGGALAMKNIAIEAYKMAYGTEITANFFGIHCDNSFVTKIENIESAW